MSDKSAQFLLLWKTVSSLPPSPAVIYWSPDAFVEHIKNLLSNTAPKQSSLSVDAPILSKSEPAGLPTLSLTTCTQSRLNFGRRTPTSSPTSCGLWGVEGVGCKLMKSCVADWTKSKLGCAVSVDSTVMLLARATACYDCTYTLYILRLLFIRSKERKRFTKDFGDGCC